MNLNTAEVVEKLCKFLAFVHAEDKKRRFSFVDKNTFLGRSEGYKAETAELARNVLKYDEWQESMIGSGEITLRCKKAMACAGNLVYFFVKDSSRFLPVSPGSFQDSLASIGVKYKLSHMCSWEKSANISCDAETPAAARRDRTASYFVRSADVAETAKTRAGGVCQNAYSGR